MITEHILRASGVTKQYGQNFALRDVDIEIRRGQIYGLIGLNGAGKSTFMKSVIGLVALGGGKIELFGHMGESGLRAARRRIGQTIENPALYPNMTAAQNLETQRLLSGVKDKKAVAKTMEIIGLAGVGKKKVKNFSLGMKQRLALGTALITGPEFLILDEPTNGLDPKGIVEMRDLMRSLASEFGLTLLVSSHILDELSLVATHYGIIHKGRMVKQLSAEELVNESRRYARIVTDAPEEAVRVLRERCGIQDIQQVAGNEIRFFEKTDMTGAINTELVRAGLTVHAIGAAEQRLEEYFIKLTEGADK